MLTQEKALEYVLESFAALGMTQSGLEARDFAVFLSRQTSIQTVVELGTGSGGFLYLINKVVVPTLCISLDQPWENRDPKLPDGWEQRFHETLPNVIEILGDIHSTTQRLWLANELMGKRIDLLFIDADHSYAGGAQHWQMYRPFVRPGGLVGFHDIRNGWPIGKFYDELCAQYPHWEFCEQGNLFGIGVIQV